MRDFMSKVAVITGAGSGMGRYLAVLLAKSGCDVVICDVNEDTLAGTASMLKNYNVAVSSHLLDVGDEEAIKALPRPPVRSDVPVFVVGMPRSGTSLVGVKQPRTRHDGRQNSGHGGVSTACGLGWHARRISPTGRASPRRLCTDHCAPNRSSGPPRPAHRGVTRNTMGV